MNKTRKRPSVPTAFRRLCIYFFYDSEGVIDEYVLDCLQAMSEHCEDILLVSNGKLKADSAAKLSSIKGLRVLERTNEGFDVWAYKHGLDTLGWDAVSSYDEVIFMNFTIVGPLYPLSEMFNAMESRAVDFWGINVHSGESYDPWNVMVDGYIPKHLQSHFIAVRKAMTQSPEFQAYWDTMREIKSYEQAIGFHEAIFTQTFEKHGFTWDSYVDTKDLEQVTSYPLMFMPDEVLKNRRSPFFKRKALILPIGEYLGATHGFTVVDTMTTLKDLGYDLQKIMPHILRTGNQADIRHTLNAVRIVPQRSSERLNNVAAIVAYVDSLAKAEQLKKYLHVLQQVDAVHVIASGRSVHQIAASLASQPGLKLVRAGYVEFLKTIEQASKMYAYVGVLAFTNPQPNSRGIHHAEYYAHGLRALFGSKELLQGFVAELQKDALYGVFASPQPLHGGYEGFEATLWQKHFKQTEKLLRGLGIKSEVHPYKAPLSSLSGMFWIKSPALKALNWRALYDRIQFMPSTKAVHIVNFALPFIVQQSGHLMAYGMSQEIAQNHATIHIAKHSYRGLSEAKLNADVTVHASQFYLRKGASKLSEKNSVRADLVRQDDGTYRTEITAPYTSKYLRFDPSEEKGVICTGASATVNGVAREVSPINAISYNAIDIFITHDSQYTIKGKVRKGDVITVTFDTIEFYSQADFTPHEVLTAKTAYGGPLASAVAKMQLYYQRDTDR